MFVVPRGDTCRNRGQRFPLPPVRCKNAGMDELMRSDEERGMGRRAFFGRVLLAAGATATVLTLSGCPGGDGGDDDGDDDGGDDDD